VCPLPWHTGGNDRAVCKHLGSRARRARRLSWAGPAALGASVALAAIYGLARTTGAGIAGEVPPLDVQQLSVCNRYFMTGAPSPAQPAYDCTSVLERPGRVRGHKLVMGHTGWHLVVRRIAPGEDPEAGTDGVPLLEDDDYTSFAVVHESGQARIYVDCYSTAPRLPEKRLALK
jgi:hypothetical protein